MHISKKDIATTRSYCWLGPNVRLSRSPIGIPNRSERRSVFESSFRSLRATRKEILNYRSLSVPAPVVFFAAKAALSLRNYSSLFFSKSRVKVQHEGSASRRSSATMNGTRWVMSPDTNATSRESRSSLETSTLRSPSARRQRGCGLRPTIERVSPLPCFSLDELGR